MFGRDHHEAARGQRLTQQRVGLSGSGAAVGPQQHRVRTGGDRDIAERCGGETDPRQDLVLGALAVGTVRGGKPDVDGDHAVRACRVDQLARHPADRALRDGEWRAGHQGSGHAATMPRLGRSQANPTRGYRPSERPMISFMISVVPP